MIRYPSAFRLFTQVIAVVIALVMISMPIMLTMHDRVHEATADQDHQGEHRISTGKAPCNICEFYAHAQPIGNDHVDSYTLDAPIAIVSPNYGLSASQFPCSGQWPEFTNKGPPAVKLNL